MTLDWSYDAWPSGEPYVWMAGRGSHPHDQIDFHVDLGCGRIKKGRIGVDRYPAPGVNVVMDLDRMRTYALAPEPGRDAVEVANDGLLFHHDNEHVNGGLPLDYPTFPLLHDLDGVDVRPHWRRLPFADSSIESIITHHALEHIDGGFIPLMDDIYRVLKPGGVLRVVVPLFPSWSAVSDPDHKRYFLASPGGGCTFDSFCGTPGDDPQNCWLGSFSVPYTRARFRKTHQDMTARSDSPFEWWTERDERELRVTLQAVKEG